MPPLLCAALLAAGAVLPGCGEREATARPALAGEGVLRVDSVVVQEEDVRPLAEAIGELYPEYTWPHRARLALTNVVLPLAAVRARLGGAERDAARERCEAARATLRARGLEDAGLAAEARAAEGGWKELRVDLWHHARSLAPGTWGEGLERPGAFVLVRVDEREQVTPGARGELFRLTLLEFPYLPAAERPRRVEEAVDSSRLQFLDPAWREYVPESWQHRMGGA